MKKLCSVCRYSRRVIWLEVGTSNSDPSVIAYHYLEAVKQLGGIYTYTRHYVRMLVNQYKLTVQCNFVLLPRYIGYPRLLRCDLGTENSKLAYLQPFLRRNGTDPLAGEHSFRYGRSVSNQVRQN